MSRPKAYREPRVTTSLRLPAPLLEAIQQEAADRDVSANWLMERLLADGMTRLIPVADLRLIREPKS